MKNFKPNQQVVFIDMGVNNQNCILPKDHEIVTITSRHPSDHDYWFLKEYPLAKNGRIQSCHEMHLFPLEEIFGKQAQEAVDSLLKEIEQLIPVEL